MQECLAGLERPSGFPRAMLEGFLDAVPASTAVLDLAGGIVAVNEAWRRFAIENGGMADGWEGTNYLAAIDRAADADADVVADGVQDVLKGRLDSFDHEYPCHSPTRQRWFRCLVAPLAEDEGIAGATVIHLDVTGQKLAEISAQLANRAKSEFLANLSHELRTPLNAIIGFSEMMMMEVWGGLGDPHYSSYAGDIHEAGIHLLSLINDVLDLSKVEAGRFELRDEEVDLAALAGNTIALVSERAGRVGITLSADLPPTAHLRADPRVLRQILLNLLSNAVKFTPANGSVVTSARARPDGWLELSVRDTGIGIAAEDFAQVLEPFGQVASDLTRQRQHEGTGLGLPLTRRFVELHGGVLRLESAVGIGTTVTACFPPGRVLKS